MTVCFDSSALEGALKALQALLLGHDVTWAQDLQSRKLGGKRLTKYLTDDLYNDACLRDVRMYLHAKTLA